MRHAMIGLAMLCLAVPAGAKSTDPEALRTFADRFDAAQIAQDRAALDAMVSDDLVFITGTGARLDKVAFIAGWMEAGTRYAPVTLEDRVIMPLGRDSWLASAAVTIRGTAGDKPFASRIRFTDIFRREDGAWRAVHIQVTKLP